MQLCTIRELHTSVPICWLRGEERKGQSGFLFLNLLPWDVLLQVSLSLEGTGAPKVSWEPPSSWPGLGLLRRGGAHHRPYPAFCAVLGHTRRDASAMVVLTWF